MGRAPTRGGLEQRILRVATELFSAKGYAGTGVQEIVDRAGATKGAFYHHFSGKEELLRRILDGVVGHLLGEVEAVLDQNLPVREGLAVAIERLLTVVEDYPDDLMVYFQEGRLLATPPFADVQAKSRQVEAALGRLLAKGHEDGVLRPMDGTEFVANGIMGMCAWMCQWYRPSGAMSASEVAGMYSDVLLDGLGARKKPPARRRANR